MALIATEAQGKDIPPAPEGTHIARCIMLVDMGTQENQLYHKWARKCRIAFELPDERFTFDENRGPEPYVVGNNFSLSTADRSGLRKFLRAWRGRDFTAEELKAFDLKNILGVPCLLTLGHKEPKKTDGRVYAEILSISPLMKGQQAPPQVLESTVYEIEQGKDCDAFKKLPEWIRKEIEKCQEWNKKIEDADVPDAPMPAALREQAAGAAPSTEEDTPF